VESNTVIDWNRNTHHDLMGRDINSV